MVTKIKIGFVSLFFLVFVQCSQFEDVFNAKGQSSRRVPKIAKNKRTTQTVTESGGRAAIVTKTGTYYFVLPGDTLSQIAENHRISAEDLAQINDLYDSNLVIGRRLFIPSKKNRHRYLSVTQIIKDEKASKFMARGKVEFAWPVDEFVLFSKFGTRRGRPHDGIDLSAPIGTPVFAAAAGKVIYSKRFAGYGNLLVIKHADQYFTAYAHAQNLYVVLGETVKQSQKIATIGRTGRTTGPHLHFEIRKGTEAIDPLTVLSERNSGTKRR